MVSVESKNRKRRPRKYVDSIQHCNGHKQQLLFIILFSKVNPHPSRAAVIGGRTARPIAFIMKNIKSKEKH